MWTVDAWGREGLEVRESEGPQEDHEHEESKDEKVQWK